MVMAKAAVVVDTDTDSLVEKDKLLPQKDAVFTFFYYVLAVVEAGLILITLQVDYAWDALGFSISSYSASAVNLLFDAGL
jgi:hypothetical protein